MNRTNYKVAVTSKKQAKQFKQALLSIGENVSSYYWEDMHGLDKQNELVYEGDSWLCDYDSDGKEITFKELLTLIVNDVKDVKPKELTVQLFNEFHSAKITKDWIALRVGKIYSNTTTLIKPSDLEDMLHAYKSL